MEYFVQINKKFMKQFEINLNLIVNFTLTYFL